MLVTVSCWPTKDLKNFTLYGETQYVDPGKLKIDGIYYTVKKKESNRFWTNDHLECFVLYNNGTLLYLHGYECRTGVASTLRDALTYFEANKERLASYVSFWGAFKIAGDTLLIQRYQAWQSPDYTLLTPTAKVFNYRMKILNDTTLLDISGNSANAAERYILYKTKAKPDSTNWFMTDDRVKKKLERLRTKRQPS